MARMRLVALSAFIVVTCGRPVAASADCLKNVFDYGAEFDEVDLGRILEKKTWQTENRHQANELITWTRLRAKIGSATLRECASCSPRSDISELTLFDFRGLPCGLKRGMPVSAVIARMGQPSSRSETALVYRYPQDEQTEQITLIVAAGRLQGIRWRFFNEEEGRR
jgi:hypothetical protein